MKISDKRIAFLFTTIFLSILMVSLSLRGPNAAYAQANSGTIHVPQDYSTIQEAIDQANPKDTIYVAAGTYDETLFIDKSLTLIGEDSTNTFIIGSGQRATIQANFATVNISGFNVTNRAGVAETTGILIENCTGSTIDNNYVGGYTRGIWLYHSNNNTVSDNLLSRDYLGILLCGHSSENAVTRNTMKDNTNGMGLTGWNNTIYHNNFINNQNQTEMIESFGNIWDNTLEGNYWSNYKGKDAGQDGIGDTPYLIDVNNQDYYPLMGMVYQFQVSNNGVIYDITAISNSSIADLTFGDSINLAVMDPVGTMGFCRLSLPRVLSGNDLTILINGVAPTSQKELPASNGIQYLYITYTITKQAVIQPFWETNPLATIAVIAVAIVLVVLAILTLLKRRR